MAYERLQCSIHKQLNIKVLKQKPAYQTQCTLSEAPDDALRTPRFIWRTHLAQ